MLERTTVSRFGTAFAAALLLAACEKTIEPFDLSLGNIGEDLDEAPAQIVFSSPRVFARETLINDRLTEIQYLTDALKTSETTTFGPELQRELNSISSFAATLRAGFNPAAGQQFRREDELAGLRNNIERTEMTMRLEALQRQLEAMRQQGASETSEPNGNGNGQGKQGNDGGEAGEDQEVPDPKDLGKIDELTRSIGMLQNELDKLKTVGTVSAAASKMTPEETYRRLRDHRAEIRADLASFRLDDAHGIDGNALYRLQFLASVIPPSGKDKNRWGVARMRVIPPMVRPHQVSSLYFDWLAHITRRLNRFRDEKNSDTTKVGAKEPPAFSPDPLYQRLGSISDLYATSRIPLSDACDKTSGADAPECRVITIAVLDTDIARFLGGDFTLTDRNLACISAFKKWDQAASKIDPSYGRGETVKKSLQGLRNQYSAFSQELLAGVANPGSLDCGHLETADKDGKTGMERLAERLVVASPTIAAAHRALSDRMDMPSSLRDEAVDLLNRFDIATLSGAALLTKERVKELQAEGMRVPDSFCAKLLKAAQCPSDSEVKFVRVGLGDSDSFAVAVTPTDEAQRISTLQRAAHAMQLALGLAATVPQAGLNVAGGVNYLNAASGSIDALERVPRLIGFTGRYSRTANEFPGANDEENAAFGWLIGPEVSVNSEKKELHLQQTAMDRIVTADVSVPGWWPHLTLRVESTWAGKLDDLEIGAGASLKQRDEERVVDASKESDIPNSRKGNADVTNRRWIRVRLPRNTADMDGLTALLFDELGFGRQFQARIDFVEPDVVHDCRKPIRFLIQGSELWREPRVFIEGHPNTGDGSIQVLPDMGGVMATIDLSQSVRQLAGPRNKPHMLTVWTRVGEARWPISVKCKETAEKPKPPPAKDYKIQLATMIGTATAKDAELQKDIAALAKILSMRDQNADDVKALKKQLADLQAAAAGVLAVALKGADGSSGLTALQTEAGTIDAEITDLNAEIARLTLVGGSLDAAKLKLDAKKKEGAAVLIGAKQIIQALDVAHKKHRASLEKLERVIVVAIRQTPRRATLASAR